MVGFTSLFSRMKDARPPCKQPKILSFREDHVSTNPSAYFDLAGPWPSISSSPERKSMSPDPDESGAEAVIRGLRSERLFIEPGGPTSSISAAESDGVAGVDEFEGSVAVAMDSEDPRRDLKRSMEEMLMVHGVRDRAWLEAILGWYLKANGNSTHGIIIGAFVELLLGFLASSYASSSSLGNEEDDDSM